jgi:fermentation-respiration switch protein FrsA (DUF1100 family)
MRRLAGSVAVGLVLGVGLVVGLLWYVQRQLIYVPSQVVPPVQTVLPGGQEVAFATADGLQLAGWFLPARAGAAGRPTTVLVFNGNAGNRAHRAPLASALARAGLAVLLFDYRGYGGNGGSPSEEGLRADARAARAYLLTRADVDPTRVVYLGESLGAAVALALAVEHPPAALILRSPFASLVEVGQRHYPWLPVRWLLADRYPSIDRIEQVRVPLLVVAGERDRVIPVEQSRRLFERAAEPKRFVLVPGADHNDPPLNDGPPFIGPAVRFLAEVGIGG